VDEVGVVQVLVLREAVLGGDVVVAVLVELVSARLPVASARLAEGIEAVRVAC
jgi:hypothetical protein